MPAYRGLAVGGSIAILLAYAPPGSGQQSSGTATRPVAVSWDGQGAPLTGVVEINSSTNAGTFRLAAHANLGSCSGHLSLGKAQATGSWAIACSKGQVASGATSSIEPISGAGADSSGRAVQLSIGAPISGPATAASRTAGPTQATPPPAPAPAAIPAPVAAPPAPVAVAPAPSRPAATTPAKGPGPIGLQPDAAFKCGRIEVKGLPINAAGVKCEDKDESITDGRAATRIAAFSGGWSRASLTVSSARFIGRAYWRHVSDNDLKQSVERWAGGSSSILTMSTLQATPFRHFKVVGRTNSGVVSCVRGQFSAEDGPDGSRHSVWVTYCEGGDHGVSDENLGAVYRAVSVK